MDYSGLAQVITAIGVLITILVSAYNNIRLREVAAKVDGAATAQTTKIENLTNQISDLKGTVAEQKQNAAVLQAQSKTVTPLAAPTTIVKEIADSTKEIADNTQGMRKK